MDTKICNRCKEEKPLDSFGKHCSTRDGYRYRCKSCHNERAQEWYQRNKRYAAKVSKVYNQTPRGRFKGYKNGAKARGIEFNLTFQEFEKMWNGICAYCQVDIKGIGIDRVINELGYTEENCVPCCEYCNRMKWKKTTEEFLEQVRKIYFSAIKRNE